MRSHAIAIVTRTLRRYRTTIWEGILLLAVMVVAALIAYEYDIFPNPPGVPTQEYVIEADEALALATLLCLGLLALSWHFLLLQRREVARRIEAERRAHELAMQDPLTGLPNRRRFDQELKDALSAPPHGHGAHAVLLLDLNAFKRVNDLYGHGIGDEVLINIAMRLRRAARQEDLVTRFGGDEFATGARAGGFGGRDQYRVARDQGARPADHHRTSEASRRGQHWHRAFPAGWAKRNRDPAPGGHRALSRQGREAQIGFALLRRRHGRAHPGARSDRARPTRRHQQRRCAPLLSAAGRSADQTRRRLRGAGALAASDARRSFAGAIHSGRRKLRLGCQQAQGYLYSRAMSANDAIDFIQRHEKDAWRPHKRTSPRP
jgi:GGDEF domain-containing protein